MKAADSDLEVINIAEDEEETKGETSVTFTEEDRLHVDFTKFYRRHFNVDMKNR